MQKWCPGFSDMGIEVNGRVLETDPEGYLRNIQDWDERVAQALAQNEDIHLDINHWEVIHFLREYYDEYKMAPAMRILAKAMDEKAWQRQRQHPLPLPVVSSGPSQTGLQICWLTQADGLCLSVCEARYA